MKLMSSIFLFNLKKLTKFGVKVLTVNEEMKFWRSVVLDNGTNSSSRMLSIPCSDYTPLLWKQLTRNEFSEQDKVVIKVLFKKRVMERRNVSKIFQTEVGLCQLWTSCWRSLIRLVLWISNLAVLKSVRRGSLRTLTQLS